MQSIQPRVFAQYRRRGVGRTLMEAAVAFAEENGVLHVTTAVPATARDANRFMARIALAPAATFRIAPTSVVRSRLTPSAPAGHARSAPRVLVARRNQRRARAQSRGLAPRLTGAAQLSSARVDERAGDARGAHPLAALVDDHDLVGRTGAAEVDRGRRTGDGAGRRGAVVGRVDVDADRDLAVLRGVQAGSDRAERLGERDRRTAVEEAVRAGCCPRPASSPRPAPGRSRRARCPASR